MKYGFVTQIQISSVSSQFSFSNCNVGVSTIHHVYMTDISQRVIMYVHVCLDCKYPNDTVQHIQCSYILCLWILRGSGCEFDQIPHLSYLVFKCHVTMDPRITCFAGLMGSPPKMTKYCEFSSREYVLALFEYLEPRHACFHLSLNTTIARFTSSRLVNCNP